MITAFDTPHGTVCAACVLARHGSLTVRERHGVHIACNHRGAPLRQQGRTLTALTVQHMRIGQRCARCQEVVRSTPRLRIRCRLAALAASLHRRVTPGPVRPSAEPVGVAHGVTAASILVPAEATPRPQEGCSA